MGEPSEAQDATTAVFSDSLKVTTPAATPYSRTRSSSRERGCISSNRSEKASSLCIIDIISYQFTSGDNRGSDLKVELCIVRPDVLVHLGSEEEVEHGRLALDGIDRRHQVWSTS